MYGALLSHHSKERIFPTWVPFSDVGKCHNVPSVLLFLEMKSGKFFDIKLDKNQLDVFHSISSQLSKRKAMKTLQFEWTIHTEFF